MLSIRSRSEVGWSGAAAHRGGPGEDVKARHGRLVIRRGVAMPSEIIRKKMVLVKLNSAGGIADHTIVGLQPRPDLGKR